MGKSAGRKEGGFVLVWALLLMVVLLILGVSGIGTSVFESMMTANDALHKQSFFQADGGSNTAAMLIEENVSCPLGFTPTQGANALILGNVLVEGNVNVGTGTRDLYNNQKTFVAATNRAGVPSEDPVSPLFRDAYYFWDPADPNGNTLPRTNIKTGGTTDVLPGGPLEMGAGYEGRGKGLPGGGARIDFDTFSQYFNVRQSQGVVEIMWRHIIGFEGTCKY